MRGKIDENLPIEAADLLRDDGWECDTVYDEALGGAEDPRLIDRCRVEGRVLFTTDVDFADIRAYPPSDQVGIVVIRAPKPSRAAVLALVLTLVHHGSSPLPAPSVAMNRRRLWLQLL